MGPDIPTGQGVSDSRRNLPPSLPPFFSCFSLKKQQGDITLQERLNQGTWEITRDLVSMHEEGEGNGAWVPAQHSMVVTGCPAWEESAGLRCRGPLFPPLRQTGSLAGRLAAGALRPENTGGRGWLPWTRRALFD